MAPDAPIDVGNAGTLMRLLPGWLAGQDGRAFTLDGDDSIRRRPVDRIAAPLRAMGARIDARDGRFAAVHGSRARSCTGSTYELPVASAQVKSCVLLAGLLADGTTTVIEPAPSRDHTERMLVARAGATVRRDGRDVSVDAGRRARARRAARARRPRSAAFLIAAGVLVAGSRLRCAASASTGRAPASCGSLERMGAVVVGELEDDPGDEILAGEPIADLEVAAGPLVGTTVEADEVPLAIDELPLVALLGCFAEGETVVRGARRAARQGVRPHRDRRRRPRALGAQIEATDDGFVVRGTGGLRGGTIASHGDHRLAMLGAVAGLASREGVRSPGMEAAAVSYPGFSADVDCCASRHTRATLRQTAAGSDRWPSRSSAGALRSPPP